MPKILHTSRYTGTPWEVLKNVVPEGFSVETLEEPSRDCLLHQVVDADYLLVSGRLNIDEEVLSLGKRIKMIQRTGVGIDMLDIEAIKRRRIPVYVNRGVNARSVAEHTLTLILSCLKNIPSIDKNVKSGIWKKQQTGVTCHELYGKSVGLVGMGAIGKQVASYLNAFGAQVYYTDVFRLDERQEKELSISYVPTFERLLPQVDILSFHCPLTSGNKEMLNKQTLSLMKHGSIIINTARGQLINEDALYDSLCRGAIRSVALDVHYEEPIKGNSRFANMDNVILTPHIAGLSFETFHAMMKEAIDNIICFEKGEKEIIKEKLLELK